MGMVFMHHGAHIQEMQDYETQQNRANEPFGCTGIGLETMAMAMPQ